MATTTKCITCNRPLRSARSIAAGYGPTCIRKVKAAQAQIAAAGTITPAQADKAAELVELNAITPNGPGSFLVASSKGDTHYETNVNGTCSCPAGTAKTPRRCYHVAAVAAVYLASTKSRRAAAQTNHCLAA